jgi:hypothetical protein
MLRYLLAAVAVFAFACWLGLTRRQRRLFRLLAGNTYSRATLRLIVITILMHGAMLAAYALVATSLVPQANIGEVLACSVIVMLAASLPISFAGWGFRELSATIVFARLGFMPGQGFVIGVVIGVLSIVALMGHIAWLGFHKPKSISDTASGGKWVDTSPLERAAYWLIGLGATAAVLFNIRVPTNTGQLNVNLGDPVAIIGGIVLLGLAWQTRTLSSLWHARGIVLSMALITAVLTLGLLHGYLVYGPIDWAIFNRFFGWFLLLAYFGTGSLLVAIAGQTGFAALSRVLVASTAAIVVFDFVQVILARVFRMTFGLEVPFRAEGMAANPNAYAFQLLLAFVVLLASADFRERGDRAIRPILMAGLYLYGLWLAGSRASLGTFAVLLVVIGVVYWREIDLKKFYTRMALGVVAALIILAAPLVIGYAVNFAASLLSIPTSRVFNPFITGFIATKSDIQADRIESIRGGLALWMAHPIFGGGLGAYIRQHIEQTGTALIIHNSMLWVAAELGIVGFAIFAMPAVLVVRAVFANRQWSDISSKVVIIGCMVVMFVMSLVHDMFYQRLFWLLMGAGLTVPYATMRTMRLSRRKLALAPGKSAEVEPPAAGHAGGL